MLLLLRLLLLLPRRVLPETGSTQSWQWAVLLDATCHHPQLPRPTHPAPLDPRRAAAAAAAAHCKLPPLA